MRILHILESRKGMTQIRDAIGEVMSTRSKDDPGWDKLNELWHMADTLSQLPSFNGKGYICRTTGRPAIHPHLYRGMNGGFQAPPIWWQYPQYGKFPAKHVRSEGGMTDVRTCKQAVSVRPSPRLGWTDLWSKNI